MRGRDELFGLAERSAERRQRKRTDPAVVPPTAIRTPARLCSPRRPSAPVPFTVCSQLRPSRRRRSATPAAARSSLGRIVVRRRRAASCAAAALQRPHGRMTRQRGQGRPQRDAQLEFGFRRPQEPFGRPSARHSPAAGPRRFVGQAQPRAGVRRRRARAAFRRVASQPMHASVMRHAVVQRLTGNEVLPAGIDMAFDHHADKSRSSPPAICPATSRATSTCRS